MPFPRDRWYTCFALAVLLGSATTADADAINLLAQTHHVWGHVQDVSYDITDSAPVAGSCQKYVIDYDEEGWVTMTSSTLGSNANQIIVDATADSEGPWMISNRADARVVYDFTPNTELLELAFDGISGDHYFESGLYYELEDLITGTTLDSRSWEYEYGMGWVDDVLPYDAAYDVILNHSYRITVGAYAQLGDMRVGYAHLVATITPEPATLVLLALAATGVVRCRR